MSLLIKFLQGLAGEATTGTGACERQGSPAPTGASLRTGRRSGPGGLSAIPSGCGHVRSPLRLGPRAIPSGRGPRAIPPQAWGAGDPLRLGRAAILSGWGGGAIPTSNPREASPTLGGSVRYGASSAAVAGRDAVPHVRQRAQLALGESREEVLSHHGQVSAARFLQAL